jgi:putative redox protein
MKPPLTLELVWEKDLVFGGRSGDASITLDSAGIAGPSPVQALAFALAGCMSMDLVYILQKARYALRGLGVALSAERAQDNPHRITAVDMRFMVTGDVPDEQVQRAIDLSRDKYCSVWHSLRQDIPLKTSFNITTTSS